MTEEIMCQMMFRIFSHLYKNFFRTSKPVADSENLETMEDKVANLETKVSELEEENKELSRQLESNRIKEVALQKILSNYDGLLKKVLTERVNKKEQDVTTIHLANLETAFYELLQKYEQAKLVVRGFQQNEAVLKKQVEEYEDILDSLRTKFTTYKKLSESRVEIKNEIPKKKPKKEEKTPGRKRRLLTTM